MTDVVAAVADVPAVAQSEAAVTKKTWAFPAGEFFLIALAAAAVIAMFVWIQANSDYRPNEMLFGVTIGLTLLPLAVAGKLGHFRGALAGAMTILFFTLFFRVALNCAQGVSNIVFGPVLGLSFFIWLFSLLELDDRPLISDFLRTRRAQRAARPKKPVEEKPPKSAKKEGKGGWSLRRRKKPVDAFVAGGGIVVESTAKAPAVEAPVTVTSEEPSDSIPLAEPPGSAADDDIDPSAVAEFSDANDQK